MPSSRVLIPAISPRIPAISPWSVATSVCELPVILARNSPSPRSRYSRVTRFAVAVSASAAAIPFACCAGHTGGLKPVDELPGVEGDGHGVDTILRARTERDRFYHLHAPFQGRRDGAPRAIGDFASFRQDYAPRAVDRLLPVVILASTLPGVWRMSFGFRGSCEGSLVARGRGGADARKGGAEVGVRRDCSRDPQSLTSLQNAPMR
jgi:hypothetical protein